MVKGEIICHVRGYKKFVIPFMAKSTVPRLSIMEDVLDFGRIVWIGRPSLHFRIKNDSAVDGAVQIVGHAAALGVITVNAEGDKNTYVRMSTKPTIPSLDVTAGSVSS